MKKVIMWVLLGLLACMVSEVTHAFSNFNGTIDLGHRFGANGYINNMPLYYRDQRNRYYRRTHRPHAWKNRESAANATVSEELNTKVNAMQAPVTRSPRRNEEAEEAKPTFIQRLMSNVSRKKNNRVSIETKYAAMQEQQQLLERERMQLQKELQELEQKKRSFGNRG